MSAPTLTYSITIKAPAAKVYASMIDGETYKAWTKAFNDSSHFVGSWDEGSKILFLGIDENGNKGGMVSRIKTNITNKFISIEHLGEYKNQKEITDGPEVEAWAGVLENYTFEDQGDHTHLLIEMSGVLRAYAEYFDATWPQALELLKTICES